MAGCIDTRACIYMSCVRTPMCTQALAQAGLFGVYIVVYILYLGMHTFYFSYLFLPCVFFFCISKVFLPVFYVFKFSCFSPFFLFHSIRFLTRQLFLLATRMVLILIPWRLIPVLSFPECAACSCLNCRASWRPCCSLCIPYTPRL